MDKIHREEVEKMIEDKQGAQVSICSKSFEEMGKMGVALSQSMNRLSDRLDKYLINGYGADIRELKTMMEELISADLSKRLSKVESSQKILNYILSVTIPAGVVFILYVFREWLIYKAKYGGS